MLRRSLPALMAGSAAARPLDLSAGSYFGRRRPEDGRIDWRARPEAVHDLVRAVAPPFPGAFTEVNGCRLAILETRVDTRPGEVSQPKPPVCTPTDGAWFADCADGRRLRISRLALDGEPVTPKPRRRPWRSSRSALAPTSQRERSHLKNVLILGVNGFIGHHLSKYILAHTDWHIYGMDLQSERVGTLLAIRASISWKAISPSIWSGSNITCASAT